MGVLRVFTLYNCYYCHLKTRGLVFNVIVRKSERIIGRYGDMINCEESLRAFYYQAIELCESCLAKD